VILAAGFGTRMLPATKSQPKEMLPVVDKPVIHYAVEELVSSGIEHITIVTAINKRAVEDYFDRSRDVEDLLAKRGDTARLQEILAISNMAKIAYVRQAEARGLADAVNTARHIVEDEPFILVLPDDIIVADPPVTKQLIDCYHEFSGGVVAVEEVPEAEVSSYGVVAGQTLNDRVTKLERMVEKPAVGEAPSRLAIVGRYLLTTASSPDTAASCRSPTPFR
jgi:UTP--glucose-1-phosphate uridylyltransferase